MDLEVFQYVSTYRVINKVAEGGMGQVYLAEQLGVSGFSKTVGIKTIRRELLDRLESGELPLLVTVRRRASGGSSSS